MLLPALLPTTRFSHYALLEDQTSLLQKLQQNSDDFLLFFTYACDDETWSEQHSEFMHNAMEYLTNQFLQERVSLESAEHSVESIQKHYPNLQKLIPYNITVKTKTYIQAANSLLLAVSSDLFRDLIRIQCREQNQNTVYIPEIPDNLLATIIECAHSGNASEIWKLNKEDLLALVRLATRLKCHRLVELGERTLKRYIAPDTVMDLLMMAQRESWTNLKGYCCEFINDQSLGATISFVSSQETGRETIQFEFLNFSDTALDLFEKLKPLITHLVCGGGLTEEMTFGIIVKSCPGLVALDISQSRSYSEHLAKIPADLQELDISQCPWLTNGLLKRLIEICPNLKKILLSSNIQLTYLGWSSLQRLPRLISLDLSRCHQIQNEDFSLILKACLNLIELNIEDCVSLGDSAFLELSRSLPNLTWLNVSRCHLGDGLLFEILARCHRIVYLSLMRCQELTERGLNQAIQEAKVLRKLDIRKCKISAEGIKRLRGLRQGQVEIIADF